MINNKEHENLLQFESLNHDSLFHFSTTIKGGISRGTYASFNLGLYSGDIPERVYKNRAKLTSQIGVKPNNLFIPIQTHEDKTLVLDKNFLSLSDDDKLEELNGIDALVTNLRNLCIGITTADCVPILLFDPEKKVLAAIHAGWKGTIANIVGKTVKKMSDKFDCNPNDLFAGIAPCISLECFEVGNEVVDRFIESGFSIKEIGRKNVKTAKMHLDLQLANKLLLNAAGIPLNNIETANLCTFSHPDKFFSARRQTIHSGRMVTGGIIR